MTVAIPPCETLHEVRRVRPLARRARDQLGHRPPHPVPMYVLAQPLAQRCELSPRERFLQRTDRALRRGEQLRRVHVAERIRREVSDQALGPMDVLQAPLAIVPRTHAEVSLVQLVP